MNSRTIFKLWTTLAMVVVCTLGVWVDTAYAATGFQHRVTVRINDVRRPNLVKGGCVDAHAQRWARHLAATGTFVHQDMGTILRDCNGWAAGEIMGLGYTSPRRLVRAWLHSPGHRHAMLNHVYRRIGVGTARAADGRLVVVVDFLRR